MEPRLKVDTHQTFAKTAGMSKVEMTMIPSGEQSDNIISYSYKLQVQQMQFK